MCPTLCCCLLFFFLLCFVILIVCSFCLSKFYSVFRIYLPTKHLYAQHYNLAHTNACLNFVDEENCHESKTMSPNQSNGQLCRFSRFNGQHWRLTRSMGISCTIYNMHHISSLCVCISVQLMAVDVRCCSISVSVIVTVSISLSIALKLLILCALVCSVHSGIQRLLFARISSRYGYPLARVWFYLLKYRTNECRF